MLTQSLFFAFPKINGNSVQRTRGIHSIVVLLVQIQLLSFDDGHSAQPAMPRVPLALVVREAFHKARHPGGTCLFGVLVVSIRFHPARPRTCMDVSANITNENDLLWVLVRSFECLSMPCHVTS